jgi:hypothetical protein
MIVWGGAGLDFYADGGRYDPATNVWTPLPLVGAPTKRTAHTGVWTGSEMIVWGGSDTASPFGDGGRYSPALDAWSPTSAAGAPTARFRHVAEWTGTEMLIWGGQDTFSGPLGTGARYRPDTDSWSPMTNTGAPTARTLLSSVWTGSELIVWGGADSMLPTVYFGTGARYRPEADTWSPTSTDGAPVERATPTLVWTGSEVLLWGGATTLPAAHFFDDGGAYAP